MAIPFLKVRYLPVITAVWLLFTTLLAYTIAVANGHIYPFVPYISDTGTLPPESCIFGQMMNMSAVFMAVIMYVRYQQINYLRETNAIVLKKIWNDFTLWSGFLCCFGISVVGNFQETNALLVHLFGAMLAFGVGVLFFLAQVRISYATGHYYDKHPELGIGRNIIYFRAFLGVLVLILNGVVCLSSLMAYFQFKGDSMLLWKQEHGGFEFRIAAAVSEWTLLVAFCLFILSAVKEYKYIELVSINFKFKYGDVESNSNESAMEEKPTHC